MIKNKTLHYIIMISAILFITGCNNAQPKPLYVYGDYSSRYYTLKKEPSPASAIELQKSIERAIKNVNGSSSGRVAPGMYANLGYLYLKNGKTDKAIANFQKEKEIYPESTYFMNRMINKIEINNGANND